MTATTSTLTQEQRKRALENPRPYGISEKNSDTILAQFLPAEPLADEPEPCCAAEGGERLWLGSFAQQFGTMSNSATYFFHGLTHSK